MENKAVKTVFPSGILYNADCFDILPKIPVGCVDMVLCDLPYGTTNCKWDTVLPLDKLWAEYKRVCKKNAAIVLTASQPFTSVLVMSNIGMFKYCWTWDKKTGRGHLVAKIRPMQQTEDVCVFGLGRVNYFPIMTLRDKPIVGKEGKRTEIMGGESSGFTATYTHSYPKTIISISGESGLHSTQKPVALFEYLIKTYTNEGDLVLDNCAGSGTTAMAAANLKRRWICIEKEEKYYEIAKERIHSTLHERQLSR